MLEVLFLFKTTRLIISTIYRLFHFLDLALSLFCVFPILNGFLYFGRKRFFFFALWSFWRLLIWNVLGFWLWFPFLAISKLAHLLPLSCPNCLWPHVRIFNGIAAVGIHWVWWFYGRFMLFGVSGLNLRNDLSRLVVFIESVVILLIKNFLIKKIVNINIFLFSGEELRLFLRQLWRFQTL